MKKKIVSALLGSIFLCGVMATPVMAQTAKPQVTILATGGTIAGSSASNTDTTDYKAGSLGVDILIRAVPEMAEIANVKGEQIANIISDDVDGKILLTLSKRCNELLNKEGQQGVVITHGTDTLEETAFFLDLTVKSQRPVVLVGAMRPATAVSADGPMNLLEAVALAAHKGAENRGVMAVLNDRIASGFYISKTNSTTNDTFKAHEQGYLGMFTSGQPRFYYTPALPIDKTFFDVSKLESLPRVDIIYMFSGMDPQLFELAMANGAKGIVIAGAGNGSLSSPLKAVVQAATDKGFPVVIATRTGAGYVSTKAYGISSGFLNPQKARLLLQLAIATGADNKKISEYFDKQR
ncbi:MAG: type II asparaginase [Saezia sp.]